jgi:hypothetical protein
MRLVDDLGFDPMTDIAAQTASAAVNEDFVLF